MRVTHIVHDFEGGGLETLVADMARRMDRARITTAVISLSGRIGRLGQALEPVVDTITAIRPLPLLSLVAPLGLARAIRATRPDVVHVHSGVWYKAARAARMAHVGAVVFTEHGREHDDPALARWLDRRAAAMTDVVVPVSSRLEAYLQAQLGLAPAAMHTVENGVDTTRFRPDAGDGASARRAMGIPPGALVVGSVGRLEPVKGYDRLLRAVARLRQEHASVGPVHVLLCGDGSQREPLRALAAELGLADVLHLPGWIDDPAAAYRLMDVFVLPSHSEGLSVSLLEAMASGVTPVVTRVGSNAEILGPGLSSLVVDASDPARLAGALAALLAAPDRRRTFAMLARTRVVTCYSQSRMLDEYTALYERLARSSVPRLQLIARSSGDAPLPPHPEPLSPCRT